MDHRYYRGEFNRAPLPPSFRQHDRQPEASTSDSMNLQEIPRIGDNIPRRFNRNQNNTMKGNDLEYEAEKIVTKMEQDDELMMDTPFSEEMRREALRGLPQTLKIKRHVKQKLSHSVSLNTKRKPIGLLKSLKYRFSFTISRFWATLKNFHYFNLWYGTLKHIQGHFGSGYASYFKFLRWVFVLDLILVIPSLVFIVVPQILYEAHTGNKSNTASFSFSNIFIGDGVFHNSVLYYGHYTNTTINLVSDWAYSMPTAYFTVLVILYLVSFVVLGVSSANSYNRSFIETQGGLENVYANKIFAGWDFGIATREAANLKSSAIYIELKELLTESYDYENDKSLWQRIAVRSKQVLVNLFILLVLAAVGYGLWLLLERFSLVEENVYVGTLLINLLMMIFPTVLTYISQYEDYDNPRTLLYINLGRTFLLGLVMMGTILVFWLSNSGNIECWETKLGEEIYRLIIFDFLFSVVLNVVLEIAIVTYKKFKKLPKGEFDVAKHTLSVIYNQGLFWVGFLYSPILPVVVVIKMLVVWYITELGVKHLCLPPKQTWRAAQTKTWFLMMTFVVILLVFGVHGFTIKSIATSNNCGPFRDYDYMYEIVTSNVVDAASDSWVLQVLVFATRPGVIALIIVALCVYVYYVREKARAHESKVQLLREMLLWQGVDKAFLRKEFNKILDGNADGDFNRALLHSRGFLENNDDWIYESHNSKRIS